MVQGCFRHRGPYGVLIQAWSYGPGSLLGVCSVPSITKEYRIKARDFIHAGEGSIEIKNTLKSLGIGAELVRRVSCAEPLSARVRLSPSLAGYRCLRGREDEHTGRLHRSL